MWEQWSVTVELITNIQCDNIKDFTSKFTSSREVNEMITLFGVTVIWYSDGFIINFIY